MAHMHEAIFFREMAEALAKLTYAFDAYSKHLLELDKAEDAYASGEPAATPTEPAGVSTPVEPEKAPESTPDASGEASAPQPNALDGDAYACAKCGTLIVKVTVRGRTWTPQEVAAASVKRFGHIMCPVCQKAADAFAAGNAARLVPQ